MNSITGTIRALPTATDAELQDGVYAFAEALAGTREFLAFEQAAEQLQQDAVAQQAIEAFQSTQQELRVKLMLNAVTPEERKELERLQEAFLAERSVQAYLQAQTELAELCQVAANALSQRVGLNWTACCSSGGCC